MNIYTSYFFKVRFFTPNQIPLSTAMWDPKWYHDNRDQETLFFDKRGVINGLRVPFFAPDATCNGLCRGAKACIQDPADCMFLQAYRAQLARLSFKGVMSSLQSIASWAVYKGLVKDGPELVLLVHEATNNPCSERVPIQEWFQNYGVTVKEL